MQTTVLVLFLATGVSSVAVNHRQRFPGSYCATRQPQQCCPGRDDTCTVPIRDSLCYCDMFCGIHNVEDCCPDFEDTCQARPTTPEPNNPISNCVSGGVVYKTGDVVKQGCNECKCVLYTASGSQPTENWQCANEACINEQDLVTRINSGRYGWTATTYTKFDGVSVARGLRYYLGTDLENSQVIRLNPLQISPDEQFPTQFDTRDAWPLAYFHPPIDQGECSASWAFSTASMAADRWSIQSRGTFLDQMSVQSMLDCRRYGEACEGGKVTEGWYYLRTEGAVADKCYPYTSGTTKVKGSCIYDLNELLGCPDAHVHKTTPPYRVASDEKQIMKEIQSQGPVQATMTVYPDLYLYERGIYTHSGEEDKETQHNHSISGTHSVKIIGWGEENGVKYWRCVNSWGDRWGEDGMFRIRRGVNEAGIEDFVVGVWARVEKHDIKDRKHRRHRQ